MHIVITGSLGHIGQPLTETLVRAGHAVTVVSRQPDKQAAIEALGARAAIGTLDDADFLTTTFAGADAAFLMVPPNFAEVDQLAYYQRLGRCYAEAIGRAGLRRVVHLSSYGAHLDHGSGFILGSHHVENLLDALPEVALTHLRPGYFYYNLLGFQDMIRHQGIMGSNYGGADQLILVHPRDIAAAAAEELTTPAARQRVRYVVSDERTASEVAQALGAALGRPELPWLTFSDEQVRAALLQHGMPPHVADNFVELGASLHSGRLREDYEQHRPAALGQVKIEDFAREFAAIYQQASH